MSTKNKEDKISFLDIFAILVKHIKFIILTTAAAAVFIIALNILSIATPVDSPLNFYPDLYKPTARILVDSSLTSKSPSSLSSSAISSMLGLGDSKNQTVTLLEKVVEGNKFKDAIIAECNLYERFGLLNNPLKKTRARLIINNKFDMDYDSREAIGSPSVLLTLSYTDTDKEFATDILKKIVILLDTEFKNIMLERVREKKRYLQEAIEIIEKDYGKAQQELINFQSQYGADLETIAKDQTKYIAQLQEEIYKKELQIRSLYLPEGDPQVIQLRDQIRQMKQLINEMKGGFRSFSKAAVPLSEIPDLQRQYVQIEMEVKIQHELYIMMRKELEKAKLEEADTMPVFQLLDIIEVPEVKDSPKRGIMCILFTLAFFAISIFLAFVKEYLDKVKANPEEHKKLQFIIDTFNVFKYFKRKKSR
ncbi:MAG: hypothetical protein JW822_01590 [Spirochaetales bacterium]|nr:hypothetical protein [Spirochaetales bacterium]